MIGNSFTTPAIVLNLQNRGEKDLLVTLLTPNHGRIISKALGAKSIKSSRSSTLQLGNIIKAHLYTSNSFYYLRECQSVTPFLLKEKKLIQLNLLFYILELLKNFAPENEISPQIYNLSKNIIEALSQNNLVKFLSLQIDFLKIIGFGVPQAIVDSYHQKKYSDTQYQLINYFETILEKPLQSKKLLSPGL